MVIKAFCDKCGKEIEDFDAEQNQLWLNFGSRTGVNIDCFDLCNPCSETVIDKIVKMMKAKK